MVVVVKYCGRSLAVPFVMIMGRLMGSLSVRVWLAKRMPKLNITSFIELLVDCMDSREYRELFFV